MAKTGYKIDYMVRPKGADLSNLLEIHQRQFPNNLLATWENDNGTVVKVSNVGEVSGKSIAEAKKEIGYVEKVRE